MIVWKYIILKEEAISKVTFEITSELNQHITGDKKNEKFMGRFYYSEQRCV